jgi:isochorismate hydrolase
VVDAFSYDLRVSVVEGATFDRGELCHKVSLFEMDMKYADVVSLDETVAYLRHREREETVLSAGKEENRPKAAI